MSEHDESSITPLPLSIWDQSTSRFHIRLVLCFGVKNSQRATVTAHLRTALDKLSCSRPDIAGRLQLGTHEEARQGWVYLRQSPEFRIPFKTIDISSKAGYTYEELKERSFPAKAFVNPRFGYDGNNLNEHESLVPVTAVRAFFVDGGLLLSIFVHHTFGDGECMLEVLHAFAAQTCGEQLPAKGTRSLDFTGVKTDGSVRGEMRTFEELLDECPEFVRTEPDLGPNQPTLRPGGKPQSEYVKDGKIFVFSTAAIEGLKDIVYEHDSSARRPSSYVVLASLLWAHSAKARLQTEEHDPEWGDANDATLTNPVNWRYRAFVDANKDYYGNAATLAQTKVTRQDLLAACEDEAKWARLARTLEACIRAVDDAYIRRRVEMFARAPDPRELGLVMDPRVPQDLAFNTWRDFGADTEWDLGIGGGEEESGNCANGTNGTNGSGPANGIKRRVKPDKLRRSQDDWNIGGTLILPARKGSEDYEVLLTIPAPAMKLLCEDKEFGKWVKAVLD